MAITCVSCERKPTISSCALGVSTEMRAKPRISASSCTASTAAFVLRAVGVMRKFASWKMRASLLRTPLTSRPAMGCAPTNSTSGRRKDCTSSTTPHLTPETSVSSAPGRSAPWCARSQASSALG